MKKILKRMFIILLSLNLIIPQLVFANTLKRQNHYPIILVHGFGGWGKGEVLNMPYWGGISEDFENILNDYGYETHAATVGPYASNWDRACELYAFIKGGTVDYGEAHSKKYGHSRYGRTYPGVYPKWGEVNEDGSINKIHLISHSMGGQTVRVLAQLLKTGSDNEISITKNYSPLFEGNKSWIHSITTISTPHDGTTLADGATGIAPHTQQIIAGIASQNGMINNPIYDFKLDQWGLKKQSNESYKEYISRVFDSSIWTDTKDISAWDLKPAGAKELNKWVFAQPDIYYFSWSTQKTKEAPITKKHIPKIGMNLSLIPFSVFMGSHTRDDGSISIDQNWWPNDGVVNTYSMNGPKLGSNDKIINYDNNPRKGVWNFMGVLDSTDHMEILGIGTISKKGKWYRNFADILGNLPQSNDNIASSIIKINNEIPTPMENSIFDEIQNQTVEETVYAKN
ncbi:esterase/lipase family protein [Anaerophilus nitritogenes]|uniref:esterase/lipase family protein n=1 Tax=Anaerophilus nitritogenes TaxID=2498136 RepID=UPI001930FAB9|nr:lipase [Anaerophilus nitritogenes]